MEHVEAHGAYCMVKTLLLTGDVSHLELELGSSKPGVGSWGQNSLS